MTNGTEIPKTNLLINQFLFIFVLETLGVSALQSEKNPLNLNRVMPAKGKVKEILSVFLSPL